MGLPGNEWFLSALSIVVEHPHLIKRLFTTPNYSPIGLYRIKICKNGTWREVTIDDLIPCFAKGEPAYSQSAQKDLWVPLIEKAYAKVHGGYH